MSCNNCGNVTLPNGSNGLNGYNAFTVTTASFNLPAVGASVNISVSASGQYTGVWAILGQIIYISDGTNAEYFEVTTAGTQTTIGVKNLGYVGTTVGNAFASGSKVSPAGVQGDTGSNGTDGVAVLDIDHTEVEKQTTSYTMAKTLPLAANLFFQNEDAIQVDAVILTPTTNAYTSDFQLSLSDGVNPAVIIPGTIGGMAKQGASQKVSWVIDRTAATKVTPYREAIAGTSIYTAFGTWAVQFVTNASPSFGVGAISLPESTALTFSSGITLELQLKVGNAADKIKVIYWKVLKLKK